MDRDAQRPPFDLDRRTFTIRLRARLPSDRRSIGAAIRPLLGIARECGCAGESEADLEIALREALANAVVHGNSEHARKRVHVRCYAVPRRAMVVAIRDEGEGFDPDGVPDPRDAERKLLPHGRGLLLMRELLDHLTYRKGGREVVLYKSFAVGGATGRPANG